MGSGHMLSILSSPRDVLVHRTEEPLGQGTDKAWVAFQRMYGAGGSTGVSFYMTVGTQSCLHHR